jgi:DNA (cytosine-5)-methyltransferase 1
MRDVPMTKKARDLFAGAGGWEVIPVRKWGWEVDGWEIMPQAVATRAAAGLKTAGGDVTTVDGAEGGYDAVRLRT